jgi:hypothetical protein
MASTISAGTTSGTAIAIAGDTTGNLAFTTQAGTYTQTLPNATGTVMVSGNMPAFNSTTSASQNVSQNTWTKIQFNTKNFDTNTNYSTTNYRFTPTVAGYYQINAGVTLTGSGTSGGCQIAIVVNNATYYRGNRFPCVSSQDLELVVSNVLGFNGTSDYVEISVYQFSNAATLATDQNNCYFSGFLARTL